MDRSAANFWGIKWPADWAYVINGIPTTWQDIKERRRQEQRQHLDVINRPKPRAIEPAYLWTFEVPGWIYGGWWCYIVTRRKKYNVGRRKNTTHENLDSEQTTTELMQRVAVGVLPLAENFETWMKKFAAQYPRKNVRDQRPAGSLVGWFDHETTTFYPGKKKPTIRN